MVLNQSATTTQNKLQLHELRTKPFGSGALIFNGAESPRNETLGLLKNKPPFK
jgi:hypothetical protein